MPGYIGEHVEEGLLPLQAAHRALPPPPPPPPPLPLN